MSLKEIFKLTLRCWPYYKPQLKHLLTYFGIAAAVGGILIVLYMVGYDLIENKVLIGDRLQPLQAKIMFVGEEYITTGVEGEAKLTDEQRQRVRNGVLAFGAFAWFLIIAYSTAVRYYQAWIFQQINQQLRVEMLARVEHLSLKFHSNARTGDAIYRVYQDSATITNILQYLIISPARVIPTLAFGALIMILFSPWFGLLIIAAAIPITVAMVYLIPKVRSSARKARESNSDLTSRIQETLAAIRVVKANAAEERMMARFERDSKEALDAAYMMRFYMSLLMMLVLVIGLIAFLIGEYFMATWALAEKATFFGGAIALVSFAVWNLGAYKMAAAKGEEMGTNIWEVAYLWSMVQDLGVGLKRAFYLLDLEPEVEDPDQPVNFPERLERVQFEQVGFNYDPDAEVLRDVNLLAEVGTITAIVGGTGSGKSTLMSLLLRLYDPEAGRILINDTDIRDLTIHDIRSNVAIALQQNVLFAISVADNISYGRDDVPEPEITAASKIACADEFITEMPDGYETELGERGGKISTGQRQRISIARAVLRDTPILILDEPTASLDAETEQRVIKNLSQWGQQKVVFIITHRLSTIRNADQIAFLEDGEIKELGSHDELMQQQGAYEKFVAAENGGDSGATAHG